jgi:hypothetical protein
VLLSSYFQRQSSFIHAPMLTIVTNLDSVSRRWSIANSFSQPKFGVGATVRGAE